MPDRVEDLLRGDRLFHLFKMEFVDAQPGQARVRAAAREEYLNAHGIAHGGLIFALLDVAFAIAVNTTVEAVGIQWSFSVFRSVAAGEVLLAEARVIHGGKRSLVVELKAEKEKDGKLVAQGTATAIPLPRK